MKNETTKTSHEQPFVETDVSLRDRRAPSSAGNAMARVMLGLVTAALFSACIAAPEDGEEELDDFEDLGEEELGEVASEIKIGDKLRLNTGKISGPFGGIGCAAKGGTTGTASSGDCTVTVEYTFCRPMMVDGTYSCVCDSRVTGTSGPCGDVSAGDLGGLGF